ncbi:MAG: LamG domain-containing protein [Myxococcales bacterium]|nr:LamG domain-containing protein [Myxococcales bacterium]
MPTCMDQLKNGSETDIDCGGPKCGMCGEGKLCGAAGDCLSKLCANGKCAPFAAALSAQILVDQPTAYWPLDEANGAVALDKSGNNRNGAYGGTVALGKAGQAGPAADFKGTGWMSTAYATSTLLQSASAGTVTALVRTPGTYIADKSGYASNYIPHVFSNDAWYMGSSVGTFKGVSGVHFWNFYTGNEFDWVAFPVAPGTWVHVAWVLGGGKLTAYVNGQPMASASKGPCASLGVFGVGRMFQGGATVAATALFPSQIQHVATFAKVLPPERILAQAQAAGLAP